MKKFYCKLPLVVTFLLFNIAFTFAQTVHWAKKGVSQGFDNGNAMVSDDSGNVYVSGQIEYSAVFDSHTLTSHGIHDILVAKYSTSGEIKWIHSAGGTGGDVANAIGIDGAHNTYIAGEVETTADFGSGITLTSAGSNDVMLAKYNAAGNIMWAKKFGSGSNDKALAIAVTNSGDCYLTGYFSSSVNFGGTQLSNSGGNDIFIVKTNSSGTVQWAKKAGGYREDRGTGIAVDHSGNVYITGSFTSPAYFNNSSLSNSGKNSGFLAKYNSSGTYQWAKALGTCCDTTQSNSVAVDENGNIYIAGYFNDETYVGSNHFVSQGSSDILIAKYDPSGNVVWAKRAGGVDEDIAYGVTVDTISHTVYVTGSIHDNASFDTCNVSFAGYKDIFLAAYDFTGNALWARSYGGGYREVGSAITVDKLGYIYTTGIFNGNADFDAVTLAGHPTQHLADFYVDKISAAPVSAPSNPSSNLSITQGNCSDLQLNFTPGNGSRRIIAAHEGSAVTSDPVDGFMYSASSNFGSGSDLGNNNFVVYDGTGNSVTVTNLNPGVTYYFNIVEYNGVGASINYRNSTTLSGNTVTGNVTINITGLQNSICLGDTLHLHASGAVTYSWSPSNDLSSGSGPSVYASPAATTDYTITGINSAGCPGTMNFTITVNPLPTAHFPNLNAVCANDTPFVLNTGTPAGGAYSGTGVNSGQFDPVAAGAGTFTLLYTYTDANGCIDDNTATIQVLPVPNVTIGANNVCENAAPVVLSTGNPSGGIYSGNGVNAGIFDPSIGAGTYSITYSYTNTSGCTAASAAPIVVNSFPPLYLGNDLVVCVYNSITIDAGPGFNSYSWSTGAATSSIIVDSSGTGLGTTNVFAQVTNSYGCANSDTILVTFDLCAEILNPSVSSNGVSIYPNPFQKEFILSSDENISFSIYDVSGRLVEKRDNFRGSIQAGEFLNAGIYFVVVETLHCNVSGAAPAKSDFIRKVFSVVKCD